jgi:putative transposase
MIQKVMKATTANYQRIREDGQIPFRVVKEMHRSNPWASNWLKRYDKEGIEGLKDITKASGRPTKMSEEVSFSIKKEVSNSKQGWTTKQVEELIIKKCGIKYKISLYSHRLCSLKESL